MPPAGSVILDFSPDGTTGSGFSLDPLRPDQVAWSFKLASFATALQTLTVQIPEYPCAAVITNTVVMQHMGFGGYRRVEDADMLDPMQCAGLSADDSALVVSRPAQSMTVEIVSHFEDTTMKV